MKADDVSRVRRFHRAVTTAVGALDDSFLGRGRPLGAARVLNAIGHGVTDLAELRERLKLDSGLMSRLLRGLEQEGLIQTAANPDDARRRQIALTEAGQREFEHYEILSDAQASAILKRHPRRDALVRAMDLIAVTLGRDQIILSEADPRSDHARHCLEAYYAELAARFPGGFDVNLSRDPDAADMVRPRGVFLLAQLDGLPLGCAGLKGNGGPVAEVKRLWVDPSTRGLGLARQLMARIEATASELEIKTLRLDTNSALEEAGALYRNSGWTEIARFNDDPYPDLFFEKHLSKG